MNICCQPINRTFFTSLISYDYFHLFFFLIKCGDSLIFALLKLMLINPCSQILISKISSESTYDRADIGLISISADQAIPTATVFPSSWFTRKSSFLTCDTVKQSSDTVPDGGKRKWTCSRTDTIQFHPVLETTPGFSLLGEFFFQFVCSVRAQTGLCVETLRARQFAHCKLMSSCQRQCLCVLISLWVFGMLAPFLKSRQPFENYATI